MRFALFVAFALFAFPAVAQDNVWTMIGPYGARVSDIAVHPSNPQIVYMSASTGVIFKSADGGASWARTNGYGNVLAIDPRNPQVMYGGGVGVYKSADGGASWTWNTKGLAYLNIRAVGVAPSDPQTLYASTLKGVHRSADGGVTWIPTSSPQSSYVTRALAVHPTNPRTVYFAIGISDKSKGLYRSADGGDTWTRLRLDPPNGASIEGVAVDPSSPQTLYAATWGAGVYKSADGGDTWTPINAGLTDLQTFAVAVHPSRPQTLYVGTTGGGVFTSEDGGASWTPISAGLSSRAAIEALAVDPSSPKTVYAGSVDGVFRTTNGGASWAQSNAGLAGYSVTAMARGPSNSQALYIGTNGGGSFRITDRGGTWTQIDADPSDVKKMVTALAVDPLNPQTVYAGFWGAGYKSTDGGASWARVWASSGADPSSEPPTGIRAIAVDPLNSGTVYLGTAGVKQPREARLLKSADGGRTWISSDAGLPAERQHVSRVVIAPSNPRTLYLVSNRGGTEHPNSYSIREFVYRSADGGASWADASAGLPDPASWAIAVDPTNEKVLYAGLGPFGGDVRIYKSVDGGASWAPSGAGLPGPIWPGASLFIHTLAVDPTNPQTVYAGTIRGVYRSVDGGASWTEFSAGLEAQNGYPPSVNHLVLDPANQTMYAAVSGGSVYAIRVPDMGGSALRMDFDGSGDVGLDDFFLFAEAYGKSASGKLSAEYAKFDLDRNGEIGLSDFFLFVDRFGQRAQ
jgi:photosystem II stability/assembly factor-like uncharacterized protein